MLPRKPKRLNAATISRESNPRHSLAKSDSPTSPLADAREATSGAPGRSLSDVASIPRANPLIALPPHTVTPFAPHPCITSTSSLPSRTPNVTTSVSRPDQTNACRSTTTAKIPHCRLCTLVPSRDHQLPNQAKGARFRALSQDWVRSSVSSAPSSIAPQG